MEREDSLPVIPRTSRKDRLRRRHPERFAELVRVASAALAREGYGATNVNRIAEIAGVGVGTLYNYFDDKDDLFLTCVEQAAATDLQVKRARVDTSAPALAMLRAIVRVDRELLELDPDGQQLLKSVFYGINSHLPLAKLAQQLYLGSIDLVDQALEKGTAEGIFDLGPDRRLAALLVNGMMETFHVLGWLLDEEPRPGGKGEHPADRALELLCRGLLKDRRQLGRARRRR